MKPRRWFVTPELLEWKQMAAAGNYAGPFFSFPCHPSGIDPWEMGRSVLNWQSGELKLAAFDSPDSHPFEK